MKDATVTTTPIVPVPCLPPGLVPPQGFLAELRTAHATPPRAYHTWKHVARLLEHVGEVAEEVGWDHPREVWLAALYHDAVYEPGAPDNEARSAAMARDGIARWFPGADIDVARVERMIELTARHGAVDAEEVDRDTALFLDCDMAVLGASSEEFDRYDARVAEEWVRVVDAAQYRAARRAFLEALLARPRIFLSDWFHDRLEARARANVRRALDRLQGVG